MVENGKFLNGDEINDFDLYSNKALILPNNVHIAAMGASSEIILFTKVGEVAGSLSSNNDLVVDARPAVIQHPEYVNESNKYCNCTLRILVTKFDSKKEAEESLIKNITSNSIYEPCEKY